MNMLNRKHDGAKAGKKLSLDDYDSLPTHREYTPSFEDFFGIHDLDGMTDDEWVGCADMFSLEWGDTVDDAIVAAQNQGKYQPGMRINHKMFGDGTIKSVEFLWTREHATIVFDSDPTSYRVFNTVHAPMKPITDGQGEALGCDDDGQR
jgi:hypothetical protein